MISSTLCPVSTIFTATVAQANTADARPPFRRRLSSRGAVKRLADGWQALEWRHAVYRSMRLPQPAPDIRLASSLFLPRDAAYVLAQLAARHAGPHTPAPPLPDRQENPQWRRDPAHSQAIPPDG